MPQQLTRLTTLAALAILTLGACGGGERESDRLEAKSQEQQTRAPGAPLTPEHGGQVIAIEMITDDQGNNKFIPSEIIAREGDVLRFTLVTGVHNVNFLPDSNPRLHESLAPTPLLQLPGQTYDFLADFEEGRYYFQCDPHALLGMVGYVKVEDR